jgi:Fe-S oxidoreductase
MEKFDWFVIPFTLGLAFLLSVIVVKFSRWIYFLPISEKNKIRKNIFTSKSIQAIHETFMESLFHRKIFKVNPLLGYMHASLAYGWFLLIMLGNLESRFYYDGHMSPPYIPIFFRFFNPHPEGFHYEGIFSFFMDLLLLLVLSGVALAWTKRMYSRMFGMKKTTVLQWGDKLALSSLWFIFPLRFFAESFTSANSGGGSFFTANAGSFFGSFLPTDTLAYPMWWAYSISLGAFFIALPYSRYMHIPAEVLLIFLRKMEVTEKKTLTSYSTVELNACSRCGICIDTCQLASSANIKGVQSAYYLQSLRYQQPQNELTLNCLMCGRCDNICPVGIDIRNIRQFGRNAEVQPENIKYNYIPDTYTSKTEVLYFAGCMTHLQPSIKKSIVEILETSGVKYKFMDEIKSICCGRPLMLSGKVQQAQELIEKNKKIISDSGAKILVTSCPICYKVFNEDYDLSIEVLHHSQYLLRLVEEEKIALIQQNINAVYHDPCELGRGSGIYEQPRKLLQHSVIIQQVKNQKENALCCGGSLGNFKISAENRKKITRDAIRELTTSQPEALITGCPLCKKTFSQSAPVQVMDIAEIVAKSMFRKGYIKIGIPQKEENSVIEELAISEIQ